MGSEPSGGRRTQSICKAEAEPASAGMLCQEGISLGRGRTLCATRTLERWTDTRLLERTSLSDRSYSGESAEGTALIEEGIRYARSLSSVAGRRSGSESRLEAYFLGKPSRLLSSFAREIRC